MISYAQQFNFLGQVLGAMILGSLVGLERKLREKDAGIRTHALVAGGSCIIMIVSKYGFIGHYDSSRVAAQIVTGIGFLGAGMILYKQHIIHGLTTAAGIWMTAAIGMCMGAELYYLSVGATLVLLLFQFIMHLSAFGSRDFITYKIKFIVKDNEQELVKGLFGVKNFFNLIMEQKDDELVCTGYIRTQKIKQDKELKDIIEQHKFILSLEKVTV
ncbi:MAG TPA: MgtC/SapB family protein [Clostridia bacterium]